MRTVAKKNSIRACALLQKRIQSGHAHCCKKEFNPRMRTVAKKNSARACALLQKRIQSAHAHCCKKEFNQFFL
jgi:hypothetical protein